MIGVTHEVGGQVRDRDGRIWRFDGTEWYLLNERAEVIAAVSPALMYDMIPAALIERMETQE